MSSKVRGYIKRITIELKIHGHEAEAGPGGLTRKRPGHNIITYSQYKLTQNKVLSRETMTASGAILTKRGEITCPRDVSSSRGSRQLRAISVPCWLLIRGTNWPVANLGVDNPT